MPEIPLVYYRCWKNKTGQTFGGYGKVSTRYGIKSFNYVYCSISPKYVRIRLHLLYCGMCRDRVIVNDIMCTRMQYLLDTEIRNFTENLAVKQV